MTRSLSAAFLVAAVTVCSAATVYADGDSQSGAQPVSISPLNKGRLVFTVGGELLAPAGFGTVSATMVANNPTSTPYTYFNADMKRSASPGFRATLGYVFTPVLSVEGGFGISRGRLDATTSGDVENVPGTIITSNLTQYVFDASLVAHLTRLMFSNGAGLPFIDVGAGYLRQAQQGNFAIVSGQIYHFGGGVDYIVKTGTGRASAIGFRANARVYVQRKGYTAGSGGATYAAIGGALLMLF